MAIVESASQAASEAPASFADRLCAPAAAMGGQDPIGTSTHTSRLFMTEHPTPWNTVYNGDTGGTIVQRLRAVQMEFYEQNKAADPHLPSSFGQPLYYGIAPDRAWSPPDSRRVLLATRPEGPFASYGLAEYRLPLDSLDVVEMLRQFYHDPAELARFEHYRLPEPPPRQLFVCTHGSVDICCAKFGVPAYQSLRAAEKGPQTWRTTHFGGHRFAPTIKDYPSGYTWGFIDDAASTDLLAGDVAPVESLAQKMRGWSGVPGPVQLLDREGLLREGWQWLGYRRDGAVLDHDESAHRWRVAMTFETPGGRIGRFEGVVTVGRELPNPGCGAHWGEYSGTTPEYQLESFFERD